MHKFSADVAVNHRHKAGGDAAGVAELMIHRDNEMIPTFAFHSAGEAGVGSINLGGHKDTKSKPRDVGNALIYHHSGENHCSVGDHYNERFSGGLTTTKFNKGFQRRMERDVVNELKSAEQSYHAEAAGRKEQMRANRSRASADRKYNRGFDIVSGRPIAPSSKTPSSVSTGTGAVQVQVQSEAMNKTKRMLGDGLGPEAAHRGNGILRESTVGRYHQPQFSGNTHDYRQGVLVAGGLTKPRSSALMQPGKADFPSFGVEDNFSKSQYTPLPQQSSNGLVEARMPGAYTPRTQPGNPSGDPAKRSNWAKGFQLG